MKLVDLLKRSVTKYPGRKALMDDVCEMTYSKLLSNVMDLSEHLKSAGCGPGLKVAIMLPNSAAYFAAFFAVSNSGATIVPMSSLITPYEAACCISKAQVYMVITDRTFASNLKDMTDNSVSILTLEQIADGSIKTERLITGDIKQDTNNSDAALMVYTSGSTGQSKMVMLTDDQLISNMFIYRCVTDFDMPNIVYCCLHLHHIYCICAQVLTHISCGDTFIMTKNPFFIKEFLKTVQRDKVTITAFVPFMAKLMADYPRPGQYDISSLRYITLSGAKTGAGVYRKLTRTYKHVKFINAYGMSEAGSRISIAAPEPKLFPVESVGKPIPSVKVRITDESGRSLSPGLVGEIEVRSPGVFKGYFNDPEQTSKTIVNGWLKTGDLGKVDAEGNLYISGRKKEMILCGGENIYPAEIEEVLMKNEFIKEAAVVPVPDERLQEVPCAFVVVKQIVSIQAIKNFCIKRLSSSKVPRRIIFTDILPKLDSSKIDKRKLKQIASKEVDS